MSALSHAYESQWITDVRECRLRKLHYLADVKQSNFSYSKLCRLSDLKHSMAC